MHKSFSITFDENQMNIFMWWMRFKFIWFVSSILIGHNFTIDCIHSKRKTNDSQKSSESTITNQNTFKYILSLIRGFQPVVKLYIDFIILFRSLFKSLIYLIWLFIKVWSGKRAHNQICNFWCCLMRWTASESISNKALTRAQNNQKPSEFKYSC